ncbi:Spondin-N [Popillia japonica]|uniref:Spondin-N n=1 Tax=Popillia japonica TaxID=7064 RepID=A0AAW1LYR9_POPJA
MSAATRLVADVPLKHSRFACYNTCWCVLLAVIVIDAFGGSARYNVEAAVMDNVAQSSSGGLRNYNRGYLDAENDGCQPDKLTVYKVILHTFWSRDKFPKHYPDWSPSAQWSKVFVRSHAYVFIKHV